MSIAEQQETLEEFLIRVRKERKELEENDLIPDYDYPDPAITKKDLQNHRPSTELNDNPGPGSYSLDSTFGRWNKGFSFSGRCPSTLVEGVKSQKKGTGSKCTKMSALPVGTDVGWKEKSTPSRSVYQSTHNAQALSEEKVKPESRGVLRRWNYYTYYHNDGPFHSLSSRTSFKGGYPKQEIIPGPGNYSSCDFITHRRAPSFSFSGRNRSSLGTDQLQTDKGIVSLVN